MQENFCSFQTFTVILHTKNPLSAMLETAWADMYGKDNINKTFFYYLIKQ